jgi:H/ACA ribonucleoprotein complex subunit 4
MNITQLKSQKTTKELIEFGIINMEKWAGVTSFDVSDYVRKRLRTRKTSHFGTLDPMVTGVLPVALNRATKLTGFFLGEDKEYEGIMRIHEDISVDEINKAIKEDFTGKIIQLPPVKSRVKRQEREREIKKFEILGKNGKEISFLVECQGGTYVRKLVHDLGEKMGIGAHMIGLKRIRAGIFKEPESVKKEDFEKAVEEYENGKEEKLRKIIIPAEIVSDVYPIAEVKKEYVEKIMHGAPIDYKFLDKKYKFETGKTICLFEREKMIGMFKVINDNNIFAKPMFVLQEIKN